MKKLYVPKPFSGGILLSYKCASECKHCMYACSPRWKADWISEKDLEKILTHLSDKIQPSFLDPDRISINHGLNLTREKLLQLKDSGLDGMLISVNPFILDQVPFERTREPLE